MVRWHIRLDLGTQERIAQTIRKRSERAAHVGANRTWGGPSARDPAKGVPGPLTPAIIRNAVHRGHAGRACADKRLLIDLARAEENLQLRGDRRRIRWVARLVCEVQGV